MRLATQTLRIRETLGCFPSNRDRELPDLP